MDIADVALAVVVVVAASVATSLAFGPSKGRRGRRGREAFEESDEPHIGGADEPHIAGSVEPHIEGAGGLDVEPRTVNGYTVYEIRNALDAAECASLVDYSRKKGVAHSRVWRKEPAVVGAGEVGAGSVGAGSVGADKDAEPPGEKLDESSRRSRQAWIGDDEHPAARKMAALAARLTGIDAVHQEALQVAVYEPQGMFVDHYDACPTMADDPDNCDRMNQGAGQRRATLLVYLNDGFAGGETEFVKIGLKIRPERGKGILFWDTDGDENIIASSMHRGNPVLSGEKWIATKWTHKRPWVGK
jgi:hypothetical protein